MRILAIAKVDPRTTMEKLRPFMEAEVRRAWDLYKGGAVREMYGRLDQKLGVVFTLEAGSVEDAKSALSGLPFVSEGLIDFDYIPLTPFPYFEALFREA